MNSTYNYLIDAYLVLDAFSLTEIHSSHVFRITENVLNDTTIYGVFTLSLTRIPKKIKSENKTRERKENLSIFCFFFLILMFCLNSNVFRNTQNSVNWTLIINHKQIEENVKISFKFFTVNVKFVSIQVNFIYVFFFFLSLYFVEICRTQYILCVIRSKCKVELFCRRSMNGPFHLNKVRNTEKKVYTKKHTGNVESAEWY